MTQVRADLADRPAGTRSVVLAHAFVAGAAPSDSERDISVGGVSLVPTSVFDGVDYTALGHLHGAHTLTETVRYSGSPLAYSFSEAGHRKGSWLVDLDQRGLSAAHFLEAPVPRRVARLRGDLESLLADPRLADHEGSWVEATLTDPARPSRAMERLQRRFPHTLVLRFDGPSPRLGAAPALATHARSDRDIALEFMTDMRGGAPSAAEAALLTRAVDACCDDTDVDSLLREGGGP
jgi:exonuclease SbcD